MASDEEYTRARKRNLKYSDGIPAVAHFIASDPDHETFVFRRFDSLAARSLFQQECELADLESQQEHHDLEAAHSKDHELHSAMRDWVRLKSNAKQREDERKRLELAEQIDFKLEKYYRALLRRRNIAGLERPSKNAIRACRIAMLGPNDDDPRLGGSGVTTFDKQFEPDLVTLNATSSTDALSKFLRNHWIFRSRPSETHGNDQIRHFEQRSLTWLVTFCSIVIATILLIGPILILYFVTDPDTRLGLVVLFIVLFAGGIAVSTGASRDSIFGATAAYTAVLVVFVSGDLGNAKSRGHTP